MKFTIARRAYQNEREEGWVKANEVFNVGAAHRPDCRTITERRALELVRLGLHVEKSDADFKDGKLPTINPNDPVQRFQDARVNLQKMANPLTRRAPPRKTKVDPPPLNKGAGQNPNPPAPAPASRRGRPASTASSSQTSPDGGRTGAPADSSSSSPAGPAAEPSTSGMRGMRRGSAAAVKRASGGSRSTVQSSTSAPGVTSPTARTSSGGADKTESKDTVD